MAQRLTGSQLGGLGRAASAAALQPVAALATLIALLLPLAALLYRRWRLARAAAVAAAEAEAPLTWGTMPLPAFDYQVAGHMGLSNEGGSLVVPAPGRIAKPVGLGYFAGEDRFYQRYAAAAPPSSSPTTAPRPRTCL